MESNCSAYATGYGGATRCGTTGVRTGEAGTLYLQVHPPGTEGRGGTAVNATRAEPEGPARVDDSARPYFITIERLVVKVSSVPGFRTTW
jgi:hypothetical protein